MVDSLIAVTIFVATAFMDALHVVYTQAIGEEKPGAAATSGALIYVVSAFAVIQYTQNWVYVLFMVAGSWVGTYATVVRNKRRKAMAAAEVSPALTPQEQGLP